MRDAKVHPYWIVPPELIRTLTAKRIGEQGLVATSTASITKCSPTGRPARR